MPFSLLIWCCRASDRFPLHYIRREAIAGSFHFKGKLLPCVMHQFLLRSLNPSVRRSGYGMTFPGEPCFPSRRQGELGFRSKGKPARPYPIRLISTFQVIYQLLFKGTDIHSLAEREVLSILRESW
jgi:hypothetical protein